MRWHQAIRNHIHNRQQILLDPIQEIQVIVSLEENGLSVVSAIIDMIITIRHKGDISAGHIFLPNRLPRFLKSRKSYFQLTFSGSRFLSRCFFRCWFFGRGFPRSSFLSRSFLRSRLLLRRSLFLAGFFSTSFTKFSTSQPVVTACMASPAFTSTAWSPRTAARLRIGPASRRVDLGAALSKCTVATVLGLPVARPARVIPLGKLQKITPRP